MENNSVKGRWNNYTSRVRQEYPELNDEDFHGTEGWYEKMAQLLMDKYGMSHEDAMAKTHDLAKEVNYDENAVDDDKIRSFKLDTNPNHTGEMTDIL